MIITWDSPTGREIHKKIVNAVVEEFIEQGVYDLSKISKMMEEMANASKEEYGKRQPGERGKYETSRTPDA